MNANPVELEQFTPVLKNVYLPFRKKAFPMLTVLMAQLQKGGPDRVKYAGNDLFFDVKLGRRGGFSASARGFYPVSKLAREKQGRLGVARLYAQIAVDGLALKAAQGNNAAYISVAKKTVEDVMDQWKLEQNRIAYGDGLAIRAVVHAKTNDTTYVIDNPQGIADSGPGNLYLEEGDDVALIDHSDLGLHGKAQIKTISLSGDLATIVLDTAVAAGAVGNYIVTCTPSARDANDTSFGAEPYGVKAFVDVENSLATFEGINDARWVAYKTTATTVDEMSLMSFLNVIRARSGVDWRTNPKEMLLLTSTGIWQLYGESLLGLRRFNAPTMELEGGFKGVGVAGATLLDDPWAPRGRIYAIHTPDLIFIDLMDFGQQSYEDSPKWLASEIQDKYIANFAWYGNIGVTLRATHGVISGITDTTSYSPVF